MRLLVTNVKGEKESRSGLQAQREDVNQIFTGSTQVKLHACANLMLGQKD